MAVPAIADISTFLAGLIGQERLAIVMVDPDGTQHPVPAAIAASADGFLPVFLAAAEAIWEDATGSGFGVVIGESQSALLGYQAEGLADVPFCVVTLSMLHAIESTREGDVLRVNALVPFAAEARARASLGNTPTAHQQIPAKVERTVTLD
ncbi:MAG: hypothetical protein ABSC06_10695 [Rhodopila sp.]|jgi:hypothetical protein